MRKAAAMADENTTPEGDETATASSAPETPATQADEPLGDAGKKALQEERRKARTAERQLAETQARLQKLEDRDKTEAQKLAEGKAAAESEAATAKQELLRYRIAASKNLPANLAARLQGATEEEMTADADALLAILGTHQQAASPNYDGGVRKPAPAPTDMNALIRRAAGH